MNSHKFRNRALATCLSSLGITSIVGLAYGQVFTPPDNCHCGPIEDCDNIPMSHSTYCADLSYCHCVLIMNPQGTCPVGIEARCDVPAGS